MRLRPRYDKTTGLPVYVPWIGVIVGGSINEIRFAGRARMPRFHRNPFRPPFTSSRPRQRIRRRVDERLLTSSVTAPIIVTVRFGNSRLPSTLPPPVLRHEKAAASIYPTDVYERRNDYLRITRLVRFRTTSGASVHGLPRQRIRAIFAGLVNPPQLPTNTNGNRRAELTAWGLHATRKTKRSVVFPPTSTVYGISSLDRVYF